MAAPTLILIAVTDTSLGTLLLRVVSGHSANVAVIITGTTRDALLHVDQQPADLVIIDHEPPFLDGLELIGPSTGFVSPEARSREIAHQVST